jgi:site-specific DNA-cytosine methylase
MASLFDGISGFCLIWYELGGDIRFVSEIEEYPIAVCKRHFGDEETGEIGDIKKFVKR